MIRLIELTSLVITHVENSGLIRYIEDRNVQMKYHTETGLDLGNYSGGAQFEILIGVAISSLPVSGGENGKNTARDKLDA